MISSVVAIDKRNTAYGLKHLWGDLLPVEGF